MPAPKTQVTLSLPILERGVTGHFEEVSSLQFMLLFTQGAYSPFERALKKADGVDGIFGPKTESGSVSSKATRTSPLMGSSARTPGQSCWIAGPASRQPASWWFVP